MSRHEGKLIGKDPHEITNSLAAHAVHRRSFEARGQIRALMVVSKAQRACLVKAECNVSRVRDLCLGISRCSSFKLRFYRSSDAHSMETCRIS